MLKSLIHNLRLQTALAALVASAVAAVVLFPKKDVLGAPTVRAFGEVIHHAIAPIQGGRIVELPVRVGQVLHPGDLIAKLDDPLLERERDTAKAEWAQAQAEHDAAALIEDSAVTRSELWLLRTKAAAQGDQAKLAELDKQVTRLGGLYSKQMVPATLVEASQQEQRALAARVSVYRQVLNGGLPSPVAGGRPVERHRTAVDIRTSPYRHAVDVRAREVEELEQQLANLSLRSPVAGIVSVLSRRPGDVVSAGTELVSVVSSRPSVIIAIVPERLATSVRLEASVVARRVGLLQPPIVGRVIELSPEVEEVPVRARPSPTIPAWGRRVAIELPKEEPVVPGEAFNVSF